MRTFTVYNHTAGPLGTFTHTARSGTDVTLHIASLATTAGLSAVAQAAIDVSGVDPDRIVVREAAQDRRIGKFMTMATDGKATFRVPVQERASYDVFLMNRTPPCETYAGGSGSVYFRCGMYYGEIDRRWSSNTLRSRSLRVFRAQDDPRGPDGPLDAAIKAYHGVINYPWMSDGSFIRSDTSRDMVFAGGWWAWCEGPHSGWGELRQPSASRRAPRGMAGFSCGGLAGSRTCSKLGTR